MTFTNDQLLCQLGVSWLDSTLWIILIGPFLIDGGRGSGNERTRGRLGMKARLEGGQCHQRLVAEDVSLGGPERRFLTPLIDPYNIVVEKPADRPHWFDPGKKLCITDQAL